MATIYDVINCGSWIVQMFKIILLVLIFTCFVKKKVEKKNSFSLLKSAYFEFSATAIIQLKMLKFNFRNVFTRVEKILLAGTTREH